MTLCRTLPLKQADPRLLAWGHELDQNGSPLPSKVYPYNRIHSPSSNLHSNVLDMARGAIANMNRGEFNGVRILRASTYDVMWTPAREFSGKPSPAGMSWFLDEYRGNKMVSHDGGDTGFLTGLAMLPDKKIVAVWMTNADWLPNTHALTHAALDVALDLEPQPIHGKRSIGQAMSSTYMDRGIDAAIKQYETLKKLRPEAYNLGGVGQLNEFGRYLLRNGHTKDAIRIFNLNTAVYPSWANTFDALGKAYEKDGDWEAAVRSYEKALELNPKQAHAADGVMRLKK